MIESDKPVSMGLVIPELVINAIKYVFPPPWANAVISVGFQTTEMGWTLVISDTALAHR